MLFFSRALMHIYYPLTETQWGTGPSVCSVTTALRTFTDLILALRLSRVLGVDSQTGWKQQETVDRPEAWTQTPINTSLSESQVLTFIYLTNTSHLSYYLCAFFNKKGKFYNVIFILYNIYINNNLYNYFIYVFIYTVLCADFLVLFIFFIFVSYYLFVLYLCVC